MQLTFQLLRDLRGLPWLALRASHPLPDDTTFGVGILVFAIVGPTPLPYFWSPYIRAVDSSGAPTILLGPLQPILLESLD